MENYDIIIIGGGPAGATAGIYSVRAGMKTLVFDNDNSMLKKANKIVNYYGVEEISGKELIERGLNQYKKLGGDFSSDSVVQIRKDYEKDIFIVKTNEKEYQSKAIILCTGVEKKKTLSGLEKFENSNVSYCAICDGFFYLNKIVAVIGDKDFALNECEELKNIAKKTYLLTNGIKINKTAKNIHIIEDKISEFEGEKTLSKIKFDSGKEIDVDGVFVALGNLSTFEIAKQLGILMRNNSILVDRDFMTNIPGVFAGGDVIGGLLQVSKAIGDGANAGINAVRYIKMKE